MTDVEGEVVEGTVEVEIEIEASPETVFDFLVVPERLLAWLGQGGTIDPRPGGGFEIDIDGTNTAVGSYVDIERPKRVSFTWGWQGSDLVPPGSTTVEITLEGHDRTTVVHLRHRGLPTEQDRLHLEGWLHFVARLGGAVAAGET